jgi:WD40 repeat protein
MPEQPRQPGGWLRRLQHHYASQPPQPAEPPGGVINLGMVSVAVPLTRYIEIDCPLPATIHATLQGLEIEPSTITIAGRHRLCLSVNPTVLLPGASIHADIIVQMADSDQRYTIIGEVTPSDQANEASTAPETTDVSEGWHLRHTLSGHGAEVRGVAFASAGATLFTASADATVRCWDAKIGTLVQEPFHYPASVHSLAVSPDGQHLAVGLQDGSVVLQGLVSQKQLWIKSIHKGAVFSVAFSPDSRLLATAGGDNTIGVCAAISGELLYAPLRQHGLVTCVAFAGHGRVLASTSQSRAVFLWDVDRGVELRRLVGHQSSVWSVAFSLDGHMLASASNDRTVCLWNATTGQRRGQLLGFTRPVYAVAISPDGELVATASGEPSVRVFDTYTTRRLASLTAGHKAIRQLAFSPQQNLLAGGSADSQVYVWGAGQ